MSPLPILFLASQLTSVAPDKLPAFDIAHTCQTEGSSVVAPGRCTQDEGKARDQVQDEWSQFAAADKATCTKTTSTDGTPSYVELLTCLEMARDAKKLKEQQSK
jgi:uncharacterized protein with NAD-binding domain and iron-sulfur cluster